MSHNSYTKKMGNAFIMVCLLFISSLSCKRSFLDVTEPSAVSPEIFPAKLEDLDLMLVDVYGRLRAAYYFTETFPRAGIGLDHSSDQAFNGGGYNEWYVNNLTATNSLVRDLWYRQFEGVSRCNAFLSALHKFRSKGVTAEQEEQLGVMEGQGLFIRAINYFILVQFYGEVPVSAEVDKEKLAVPLWDTIANSLQATNKERATIGEIWNQIISDLEKAEQLMSGKTAWDDANRARADIWSVKGFLAKAYAFSLQWEKARDKARELIDQSGKSLMPYDIYRDAFNGNNEFNSESLFEINFTADTKDVWSKQMNNSTQYGVIIGPAYIDGEGNEVANGYGNIFIHDANIRRFGFKPDAVSVEEQQNPDYIAQSLAVRNNKEADPRLYVCTLQPYLDSIFIENVWRKIAKNTGKGYDLSSNKGWSHRKFVVTNRWIWADELESISINMYFLRLADIYLIYVEALMMTGNDGLALEYVNKIKRRAYGYPHDNPSPIDYTSLSAPTNAAPGDPLANDPLKYERWAELFGEGHWWFDVRRWKLGDEEAAYYDHVKSGKLVWNDYKYALPIPQYEMNNNDKIQKQNDGY